MNSNNLLVFALLAGLFISCNHDVEPQKSTASLQEESSASNNQSPFLGTSQGLNKYWYQGKAELNVYDLEQNRYQSIHPGQALLIFVSEDFLTDKQVKNDRYSNPNSTGILKTNAIVRFTTGLYDYSIMNSIFTPVKTEEFPRTLKIAHSGQDWCGQVFQQVNLAAENYKMQLFSYFEAEGDTEVNVQADFLEDEIPNRIRMLGLQMPVGEFEVIPALNFLRLRHQQQQTAKVLTSLEPYDGNEFQGEDLVSYQLDYPDLKRKVAFVFQSAAPYIIEGWTDSYSSAFDGKIRTSIARRTKTELLPYWSLNDHTKENAELRMQLGWEK